MVSSVSETEKSFVLELPTQWLNSQIPSEATRSRDFVAALLIAVCQIRGQVKVVETSMYSDRAPRWPGNDELWISYHSIGEEAGVWRIKESYIPNYYTLDRLGYSGFSELARFPERFSEKIATFDLVRADEIIQSSLNGLVSRNESKYDQRDTGNFHETPGYIFFPMQTVHDAVQQLSRISQVGALRALASLSASHGVPLVVKRHPYCHDEHVTAVLSEVCDAFPTVKVTDASVHDIIRGARAIVGANSGVLFEAALHGKTVFSFGESDFNFATRRIEGADDLSDVFRISPEEQDSHVRQFLGWYLSEYCLSTRDPVSMSRRLSSIYFEETGVFGRYSPDERIGLREAYARAEILRRDILLNIDLYTHQAIALRDQMLIDAYESESKVLGSYWALNSQVQSRSWTNLLDRITGRKSIKKTLLPADKRAQVDAGYYDKMHAEELGYIENNWLIEYIPLLAAQGGRTIVEIGCGNGKFLRAAAPAFESVIGVDWVQTATLPLELENVTFKRADLSRDGLPSGDLMCSADVLEHISGDGISSLIAKMVSAAPQQFHVIACYDDNHSHLAVYDPGTWLALFRKHMPDVRLHKIEGRYFDSSRPVCVITNLPRLG
ncbi:hypothetical protein [Agrobacterium salinitolerans]|uniref:hypothetical protein n=1 Tax=Agrobacterium salinitolerans TaxID=1183413 RepID=UPI0022B84B42|nr:hypothetical protein [Agrobacterium salinitolerans]MCZ7887196.1 hypothetical protein [Agrobacterium salinitolerans]